MVPPRVPRPPLEAARRALADGAVDAAAEVLELAARGPGDRATRARIHLELAATEALYGVAGLDRGLRSLREVAAADPGAVRWPLYRALHWEFRALQGAPAHEVRKGVTGVATADPVAAYHAASALWTSGAGRSARRTLDALVDATLPLHLRWRRSELLGRTLADAGEWSDAVDAFSAAHEAATPGERPPLVVRIAEGLVEIRRPDDARALLEGLALDDLDDDQRAWALWIAARAELDLGNPGRALERLAAADRLADAPDVRFEVVRATADALQRVGRPADAAARLTDALEDAPAEERPYVLHERAVALLDADLPEDAEEALDELLLDPDYPYPGEATADLAEARLRRGELAGAREAATRALDLGAVAPACLTLGTVAFEYFDLDEAVVWLERVVAAAPAGDPTWLAAQQLLADVFAQRGPGAAERLLTHARQALAHTEPGSEWAATLEAHQRQALRWLGGHERWLN